MKTKVERELAGRNTPRNCKEGLDGWSGRVGGDMEFKEYLEGGLESFDVDRWLRMAQRSSSSN